MAGQWFGLPKLFPKSENLGYEIVKNDDTLIQFKNKQVGPLLIPARYQTPADSQRWSFHLISKQATINALVSIVLDPATKDSDFPLVLYHKDQANEKDYSHEGFGFKFKKIQADMVSSLMSQKEVKLFKGDEGAGNNKVNKYGSGTAQAPMSEAAK
jgi:hypothetical protein